ncbi:hypothetical protein RclHR1_07470002 [Rhizophagus clarus]|uniref:VWFA domain-containing protein n=1 Tax=Rhizophagus clarus TaxID=94130 RepID=A0A2Z6SL15_9GLOM|nr:hypothetical protein RclHR1_07470002 [Rhizophagus clarus]GES77134.1 hypothetical protein GLOIN_2v1483026 [Rhizophagus clarus]
MQITNSAQVPDNFEFQENEDINGSAILIDPLLPPASIPLEQQQTNIKPKNLSNVQGENEIAPQLKNNDIVNQPVNLLQQDLSQIGSMNLFNGSNMQRSVEQKPSDQVQNNDNLIPDDFSKIMSIGLFSNDHPQHDQIYESATKGRADGILTKESRNQNVIPIDIDEIANTDMFTFKKETEMQKSNYDSEMDQASVHVDNSSMIVVNFGDDIKNKIDPKKNIREILENKEYSSTKIKDSKDLADCIPGLYRLLDLCKDDGSNGLVDKIIISKESLKKLCNDMVPLSFKSISDINFTKLNSISFRLIGCYGNHTLIAKLLLNKNIINQQIYDLLLDSQSSANNANQSSLRPGIYLLAVNPDLGLVIHWPETGCYEENASPQRKKNMTNLHRYLTKLTDNQLCLMSDKDLESFDWHLDDSDVDSDEDDGASYEFEVKKSQEEQEDFKIHPGFKVNLSNNVRTEINNNIQDDVPLYPIVVESTTNQSFVTRKMMKTAKTLSKNTTTFSASSFSIELHKKLQGRSLYINRESMDMKQLELLIINGFKMENGLLKPFYDAITDAKSQKEKKKDQEKDSVKRDAEIISKMAWKKLEDTYSIIESRISGSNFVSQESKDKIVSEEDVNRIQSKYPNIEETIKDKIKINSQAWYRLKKRYALACIVLSQILNLSSDNDKSEKIAESAIQDFYNMFVDKENDIYSLVKKYERQSFFFSILSTIREKITFDYSRIDQIEEKCKSFANNKPDSEFVQDLVNSRFFGKFTDIKEKVLKAFLNEYQKWKTLTFPDNIREMVPKFSFNKQLMDRINDEYSRDKKEIENCEFERICNELEEKYHNGPLRLNILNVTTADERYRKSFRLIHELETTQPNQLKITIYDTSLSQSDVLQIQDNELYIPTPILSSHQYGITFQIDPAVYDFRKISQFDNRKFLLVLYNKKEQRIEIFFDTAQRLAQNFKSYSTKPFKTLNIDENFLMAINEPRELIAIYNTKEVKLNVFSFSDNRSNLYGRNANIQLLQWYNNNIPNIKYFLFIKDTEELCFVEKSGRARIFNLVNQQFRPAICNLPSNTVNVLSSPDGSCIVAFTKEKMTVDPADDGEIDGQSDEETESTSDKADINDCKELCRAYVYFCTNFGDSVSKVIDLPANLQFLEFLEFTCINKCQTHLMSLDLQTGCFNSAIIKITLEKTQYRFQERKQRQSIGRVKLIDPSLIEGQNTHFKKSVQVGENIVIMGEKYSVIKVLSDTKLRVAGNSKPLNGFDKWTDFRIEPKTKLNGLIDAYKLMFDKYPVENCIDPVQNRPLSLKIVLDVNYDIEKYDEKFEEYIAEIFENLKRSTKKPASILKKFTTSVITFQELDIEDMKFQKKFSSEYELGEWVIQLCCLIPIQIAVAKNNLFQPLKDGLSSNEIDQVELDDGYGHHVDSITKNISFGWYEGIFKHFGDKKVKVISSMGEQSCGKSFMLNHLVGTTFDGSAMRCTEGVWMSLVNTNECIYVALDFEGLKSLERTPQEDLFLTLFNTVVSNLILFKNQFVINRDMSSMFQRFQDGATLFESDSKIFQAKLCIIIKDVPKNDKDEIVREFKSKFSQIVSEEGEDNFISRMYKGGLDIIPWPMFNDAAWFKTLSTVNKKLDKQEIKYENARTFLQSTKVIMAKLKICDWGSLDENLIQIRVATLKRLLPTVVSYGLEQKDTVTEQLTNHDSGEPIDDPIVGLSEILHDFEKSSELLPDSDIQLYEENGSFERLSEDLRCYFEENVQPRRESSDDIKWFTNFERFFKYIIERRVLRVRNWYMQNTAKFPQDNSDIVNGKYLMEQEISKLILFWTLCGLTCNQCNLKCVKNRDHQENHDCLTDHKCHFLCHFIEAHNNKLIPACSHKAGHEGKHACDKISHLCGKPCSLIDKRNCQKVCSKEIGHDDSEHLCQSKRHYCGKDCSLSTRTIKGDYRCPNKCIISYEEVHDSHRCENETCPIQCPIPDCKERCQSNNHFHSDLQVDHFCGNEHQCQKLCEDDGICKVTTEPRRQEEVYNGLVKETSITFTKYIQSNERLKCIKKIPPNKFEHTGKHTHGENSFHFCDAKCQFCEYFCTLPYGHKQIHDTRHGNMTQTEFTGESNEFEYAGHKLRVGDQGVFVLCNLHCKDLGRHRHIDYCQSAENCKLGNQGQDIQHINEKVHPNPDKSKDFISHKLFWERTGFKDPYSVQEQQEFTKCDHECSDEKHHKSQGPSAPPPTKSFCELQLFHVPLNPSSNPPNDYGYISLDGHHFDCENPSTREAAFHIIFVLDRSGSMSCNDKKPIPNFPIYNDLIRNHNNRTGAVYQAVYQFMDARINSAKTNQNQMSATQDSISLILFDHEAIVPFEYRDLTDPQDLLNSMLQHQARGGTNYDLAIQKAGFLITSHFDPTKVNIIIFLSDGLCGVPFNQLHTICKQNKTRGSPLYLYTVLFSSDSRSHSLEEMARIAQSYHPQNSSSGALRCQFTRTVNEVTLVNHFTGVAESLRKHKPALLKKKS